MRHARRYACWALFFCLPVAVSHAETKEQRIATIEKEGTSLLQHGNYPEAFAVFQKGARLGSATSMTYLGYMCSKGMGVARNPEQGFAWTSSAAQQGDAEAEAMLGMMYQSGSGTTKDLSEALTWYSKAAQHGNATAKTISAFSTARASELPRTMRWHWHCLREQRNKDLGLLRLPSAPCTSQVRERHRIMLRRSPGSTRRRRKELPPPKLIWD